MIFFHYLFQFVVHQCRYGVEHDVKLSLLICYILKEKHTKAVRIFWNVLVGMACGTAVIKQVHLLIKHFKRF